MEDGRKQGCPLPEGKNQMRGQRVPLVHDPVFRKSSFCKELSNLELNAVTAFLEPRRVKRDEVIFEEGAVGEEMFILVHGSVSAWVKQTDGTTRRMFGLKSGDFFGEMSIIVNESRSATIIAQEDSELLVLHGTDFYRLAFEYPMIGKKLLHAIIKVQNVWLEQTSRHLGDLMRWGETARRRAISDELTGLYNRRFLEESANDHFTKGAVKLSCLSLMMMDLDKIHQINTDYGTKAGDLVFISTAEILRSTTRAGDICARLSGDEFAVLLPFTEPEEAGEIGEKIRVSLNARLITVPANPEGIGTTEITVHTSIGVAAAPIHADSWEALSEAADKALRRSKELGRNRVVLAG
jgi:diguanylate cyclase (GGDEF)-like protein